MEQYYREYSFFFCSPQINTFGSNMSSAQYYPFKVSFIFNLSIFTLLTLDVCATCPDVSRKDLIAPIDIDEIAPIHRTIPLFGE